jgi:hypothetical protein
MLIRRSCGYAILIVKTRLRSSRIGNRRYRKHLSRALHGRCSSYFLVSGYRNNRRNEDSLFLIVARLRFSWSWFGVQRPSACRQSLMYSLTDYIALGKKYVPDSIFCIASSASGSSLGRSAFAGSLIKKAVVGGTISFLGKSTRPWVEKGDHGLLCAILDLAVFSTMKHPRCENCISCIFRGNLTRTRFMTQRGLDSCS